MNKKKFILLITVFLMAVITSACGSSSNQNNETKNASDNKEINEENNNENDENNKKDLHLTELLPDKKSYKWDYDGSTEYGHNMELKKIEESADKVDYTLEGEVEDASGGESESDFSLDLTYTVTEDKLIQNIDSEMVMDSNFPEIELIKSPLSEGNEWTQTQKNSDGEEIILESAIDSIENEDGQDIYTVIYEDKDSDYYEKREIKDGVGVISFENTSDNMPMKYEINYDATGYPNNKENNEENNENSEVLSEFSDEEIEYARVWLEVIDNKDTEELNVSHISAGEPVNTYEKEESAEYPEDVISLSGKIMADGMVIYSGNGDGTINLYAVPSHWQEGIEPDGMTMKEYTQDIVDNPEKIEVDTGDDKV